jgi:hypothetical protein
LLKLQESEKKYAPERATMDQEQYVAAVRRRMHAKKIESKKITK